MKMEKSLNDFEFWGGAADNAAKLTPEELDQLEEMMEEMSPDEPWSITDVNDTLWFDFEMVCEWLGLDYDEVMERK
jgi:hypothetical protein